MIVRRHLAAVLLLLGLIPGAGLAQEAWLVTYGPGSEVWERFGHNAIWLKDPNTGLDHTFSFGYFELDRPGFHRDFARGIMLYYGAAGRSEREFAFYRQRDRTIRLQQLDLDPDQIHHLFRLLDEAIFPQPQYYQYNYYLANCSTWLRDLLDQVLDGPIGDQLRDRPETQNFRDHTRRLTMERFWLHTGMMLLLGPKIDQPRTAWEETFLPDRLAYWIDQIEVDGRSLVISDEIIYQSRTHAPPEHPAGPWGWSLVLGLLAALLILWAASRGTGFHHRLPWLVGLVAAGCSGLVILLMWLATGHAATAANLMALILNPLWLILLLPGWGRFKAMAWWLLALGLVAGSVLLAWPNGPQYRPDQLLLVVPICLALLVVARMCTFCRPAVHKSELSANSD